MATEEGEWLLKETNALLSSMNFGSVFTTIEELQKSASSMFVAIYEKLFCVKLANIIRQPKSEADYRQNAQEVLTQLSTSILSLDLTHLTGEQISCGDLDTIQYLVQIFVEIYHVMTTDQDSETNGGEEKKKNNIGKKKEEEEEEEKQTKRKMRTKTLKTSKCKKKKTSQHLSLAKTKKIGRFYPRMDGTGISSRSSSERRKNLVTKKMPSRRKELSEESEEEGECSSAPSFGNLSPVSKVGSDVLHSTEIPSMVHSLEKSSEEKNPDIEGQNANIGGNNIESSTLTGGLCTSSKHQNSKANTHHAEYKLLLKQRLHDLKKNEALKHKVAEKKHRKQTYLDQQNKIRSLRLHHDLRMQRVSLGLKLKSEEERNLKHVMHDILLMEQEKLKEEQRKTDSILNSIQKEHEEREASLENFYADQIGMIRNLVKQESKDRNVIQHAQKLASEQFLRELKAEREKEVEKLMVQREHLADIQRVKGQQRLQNLKAQKISGGHDGGKKKKHEPFLVAANLARTRKIKRERELAKIYSAKT